MKQGGKQRAAGFTIVEVLIVLAATSALFVIAAIAISGRQDKTSFMTAINDAKQQIQQTINETTSGYANNITCTATSSAVTFGGTSDGSCTFMGKALQFYPKNTSSSTLNTYVVAGWAGATGATPTAIPTLSSSVSSYTLQSGLTVQAMYYDTSSTPTTTNYITGVGLVSSIGQLDGGGNLSSGTSQLTLVPITAGASAPQIGQLNPTQFVSSFRGKFAANYTASKSLTDVAICLASGTTSNQSGLITISAGSLAVDLTIYSGGTNGGSCGVAP